MQSRALQAVEYPSPPHQLFFVCLTWEFTDRVVLRKTVVLSSGWEMLPESSSAQGTLAGCAGGGSGSSVLTPFTRSLSPAPASFRYLRG